MAREFARRSEPIGWPDAGPWLSVALGPTTTARRGPKPKPPADTGSERSAERHSRKSIWAATCARGGEVEAAVEVGMGVGVEGRVRGGDGATHGSRFAKPAPTQKEARPTRFPDLHTAHLLWPRLAAFRYPSPSSYPGDDNNIL